MTIRYAEVAPPRALSRHIRCLWRLRGTVPAGQAETIYPDGCCEVIFHRGPRPDARDAGRGWHRQTRSGFAGQFRSAIRLRPRGAIDCLGIRLQPAAAAALDPTPGRLRDRVVDLDALAPDLSARILAMLDARNGDEALTASAWWAPLGRHLLAHSIDPVIEGAVLRLLAADGLLRVADLAADANLSIRAFQVRFLGHVGLTPKEFARTVRLQATLRALDHGNRPLADLALSAGFADQSHASRELRRMTGLTPSTLRAALSRDRHGEQTLRLAAAFLRGAAPSSRDGAESGPPSPQRRPRSGRRPPGMAGPDVEP